MIDGPVPQVRYSIVVPSSETTELDLISPMPSWIASRPGKRLANRQRCHYTTYLLKHNSRQPSEVDLYT
jgi:hypothetical protein